MIYKDLPKLLALCSEIGLRASMISNGLLADRLMLITKDYQPDAVAISFDGQQALHDYNRKCPGSFRRAIQALRLLAATSLRTKVGASIAVLKESIAGLPELVTEIAETRVDFINLHPVSIVGRAKQARINELSESDLMRLFLVGRALALEFPDTIITSDVYCSRFHTVGVSAGELVNPLVVKSSGTVLPFTYHAPSQYALASVDDSDYDLRMTPELLSAVKAAERELSNRPVGNAYQCVEKHLRDQVS